MVDRFTIPLIINPSADETNSNANGPWSTELLRNRVSTEFENPYGSIGEAYSHGPEVFPFDDIQVVTADEGVRSEYERFCEYLGQNPQKSFALRLSTNRPSILRDMSFRVRRNEPTSHFERQRVPVASFIDQNSENNTAVVIPLRDVVWDSWTFLEISLSVLPEATERVMLVVETNGGADVRDQIR